MVDKRIEKLADVLVNYSVSLKKGEKILIEAKGIDYMLVNAIVKEVYKAGGLPFVELFDNRITRELLMDRARSWPSSARNTTAREWRKWTLISVSAAGTTLSSFPTCPPTKCRRNRNFIPTPSTTNCA